MKKEADQEELLDLDSRGGGHTAGIVGAIALAAVVGLGVGLLAAPQAGERTRKALKKRLASLGDDLEESLGEIEERSRPARKMLRQRAELLRDRGEQAWEEIEERLEQLEHRHDDRSSGLGNLLTFAAGLAGTYFLTSDQAAPTRAKVRDAASNLRERATDRWDRFQERRHSNGGASESKSQTEAQPGGIS
ncbi:MAG: YtxH domain-containing protein [Gemmatimonadales bacterium]